MSNIRQTAISEEKRANQTIVPKLTRWAGLAAVAAGFIFASIQPFHPPDVVSSVTTPAWSIITSLKMVMCFFLLLGLVGIYARQVKEAGWLGLAGFLLFSFCWVLQTAFVFAETFILPLLANTAPQFVDSLLGVAAGRASTVELGVIPIIYGLGVGGGYMLGGVLFGLATFRAGVLPRLAAGLLSITALLTPAAALLPHQFQRFAAIPMGLALAWLGLALWFEGRSRVAEPLSGNANPPIRQTAAE